MTKLTIEPDIILKRLDGVQAELADLYELAKQSFEEFSTGTGHDLAELHLHHCLEGVFNISSHLISRLPGSTATQYKEVATKMGEFKLVPQEFAQNQLVKMAGFRNRIVHFYAEITAQELYDVLQNDLGDFDTFLSCIKDILQNPAKYNLQSS